MMNGMQILQEFVTDPHRCHYLARETATLHYFLAPRMTAEEYEALMNSGHRKFGPVYFRPECANCVECRPIRIATADFKPNRSQRRAWKRNQDLQVRFAPATVDTQRLELYRRYHVAQNTRKGWEPYDGNAEEYAFSYVNNPVPNVEISLWEVNSKGETLRAVIHNDITPNTVSSIYHFYDPECRDRGLGTACILHSIELAHNLNKRWVYLGYYVTGCGSLAYKANFHPCEIMDASGRWTPFENEEPHEGARILNS